MKDFPESFWAATFIAMACLVAVVALYAPTKENVTMAVITMTSSIITGAFGYIQGRKDGTSAALKSFTQPVDPAKE